MKTEMGGLIHWIWIGMFLVAVVIVRPIALTLSGGNWLIAGSAMVGFIAVMYFLLNWLKGRFE